MCCDSVMLYQIRLKLHMVSRDCPPPQNVPMRRLFVQVDTASNLFFKYMRLLVIVRATANKAVYWGGA